MMKLATQAGLISVLNSNPSPQLNLMVKDLASQPTADEGLEILARYESASIRMTSSL